MSERARVAGTDPPGEAQARAQRVKQLTLIACIMGSGIALLDGSVVNVALPSIQRALGGGLAGQQWVSNAYLLTLGSLILVGARWVISSASGASSRSAWRASGRRRCCAHSRRASGS